MHKSCYSAFFVASLLLHVDPYDAGALLGEGVQVGPVREVAPGGQREVDVVAEGDLEYQWYSS